MIVGLIVTALSQQPGVVLYVVHHDDRIEGPLESRFRGSVRGSRPLRLRGRRRRRWDFRSAAPAAACADGVAWGEPAVCCERRVFDDRLVLDERQLLHCFGWLVGRQGDFRQRACRRAYREWQLLSDL